MTFKVSSALFVLYKNYITIHHDDDEVGIIIVVGTYNKQQINNPLLPTTPQTHALPLSRSHKQKSAHNAKHIKITTKKETCQHHKIVLSIQCSKNSIAITMVPYRKKSCKAP